MKELVVYFSKDNNTRAGANFLAEKIGAEIVELKEEKAGSVLGALFKRSSNLLGKPWEKIIGADRIFIMGPIWGSNVTPAINGFIKQADFSGIDIVIITFQASGDFKHSDKVHGRIEEIVKSKNGTVSNTFALLGGNMGKFIGDERIIEQIEKKVLKKILIN